jgi:hypothetical protein
MKRLTWKHKRTDEFYDCYNDDKEHLGHIQFQDERKNVMYWAQYNQIRMSPGCFQEVADEIKKHLKLKTFKNLTLPKLRYSQPDFYDDDAYEIYEIENDTYIGYLAYEKVGAHWHLCWYQESGLELNLETIPAIRKISKELLKICRDKTTHKLKLIKTKIKIGYNLRKRYLCNQAVNPKEEKLSRTWDKVTCKNCLNQKPKND